MDAAGCTEPVYVPIAASVWQALVTAASTLRRMQKVWCVVHQSTGWGVVDLTGKPQMTPVNGQSLTSHQPTMVGAIVEAVAAAGRNGAQVVALTQIQNECLLIVG